MEDAARVLEMCGYVHFLAQGEAAPLDGRMFRIRQRMGAQAVPELVIASILAKKIAAGVRHAGLDVRVAPHGNFGRTWSTAARNAKLYGKTADLLKIRGVPVLTEGRFPYQPYIGRAESMVALYDIFEGQPSSWLADHCRLCRLLGQACLPAAMRCLIAQTSRQQLRQHFEQNLQAQGADFNAFVDLVKLTKAAHDMRIVASQDGFCVYPLEDLRETMVGWQTTNLNVPSLSSSAFPDPVGIVLLERPGDWVMKGTPLATVRAPVSIQEAVRIRLSLLIGKPSSTSFSPSFESIYG